MRIENQFFRQEAICRWKKTEKGRTFAGEIAKAEEKIAAAEALEKDPKSKPVSDKQSKTVSEIIVKPDGSRVLMTTISIGGMETTMSLKISEPSPTAGLCDAQI